MPYAANIVALHFHVTPYSKER